MFLSNFFLVHILAKLMGIFFFLYYVSSFVLRNWNILTIAGIKNYWNVEQYMLLMIISKFIVWFFNMYLKFCGN